MREANGFSFRKLAQITSLSPGFLCDIEKGRSNPSIDSLGIIAKALNVSPIYFLDEMLVNNEQKGNLK